MSTTTTLPSDTFVIGGDMPVHRLGYGAMQITGDGVWGWPADPDNAKAVLRRAVELGVDFIDTADSYGPHVSEELIREALHPYGDVVIATKAGFTRSGPRQWHPVGRPEYLRQQCEMSLRRLDVERLDLFQLHRIDRKVPAEDQFGLLHDLQAEGKVRHIGLSEVSVEQLEAARQVADVATVQNLYNLSNRSAEPVLQRCEELGIGFIPWFPIDTGRLAGDNSPLTELSEQTGATPAQLALAWLLRRSPVMLPIPGTKSLTHLEENMAAGKLHLTDEQAAALNNAAAAR